MLVAGFFVGVEWTAPPLVRRYDVAVSHLLGVRGSTRRIAAGHCFDRSLSDVTDHDSSRAMSASVMMPSASPPSVTITAL